MNGYEQTYSFSVELTCDATRTTVGGGLIERMDKTDPCAPIAFMKHAAGCPTFTANEFVMWISANPTYFAAVQIIVGIFVAFMSLVKFPEASAVFAWLMTVKIIIFTAAEVGFMDSTMVEILVCAGAIVAGIIVGLIVKTFRWIGVFLIGTFAGLAVGTLLYGLSISSFFHFASQSTTKFCIFMIIFGLVGAVTAVKQGKVTIRYGTSIVGSFTVMHGWYLIFGGLPEEFDLVQRLEHGERIELGIAFYVYCVAFVVLFALSAFV